MVTGMRQPRKSAAPARPCRNRQDRAHSLGSRPDHRRRSPHDPPDRIRALFTLKPVAADIWIADGGWIRFYGLPFPTRMTVVRLACGGLWVHSLVADQGGLAGAVAELGPVRHLIAPNWIHYAWVPDWQARFPQAVT